MSWVHKKIDFTVDEGKGRLDPSRDKKLRQAPQKEGFLLCDSGWCVHILTEMCSLTSRISWMATNNNNTLNVGGNFRLFSSRKVVFSFLFFISRFLPTADAHTSTCTRQPVNHRDTTVFPTCDTVAFREMSSTVSIKYYCFPTIFIWHSVSFRRRADPHSQVHSYRAALIVVSLLGDV